MYEKILERIMEKLSTMDDRLDKMDARFDKLDDRFDKMDEEFKELKENIRLLDNRITEEHELTREESKNEIQYVYDKVNDLGQDFSTVKIVTADNMKSIAILQAIKDKTKM